MLRLHFATTLFFEENCMKKRQPFLKLRKRLASMCWKGFKKLKNIGPTIQKVRKVLLQLDLKELLILHNTLTTLGWRKCIRKKWIVFAVQDRMNALA